MYFSVLTSKTPSWGVVNSLQALLLHGEVAIALGQQEQAIKLLEKLSSFASGSTSLPGEVLDWELAVAEARLGKHACSWLGYFQ